MGYSKGQVARNGPQIFMCYCDRVLGHLYLLWLKIFVGPFLPLDPIPIYKDRPPRKTKIILIYPLIIDFNHQEPIKKRTWSLQESLFTRQELIKMA